MNSVTDINDEKSLISIGGIAAASGISVETLRNWERRYGFPVPVRLASGHRRYPWKIVPRLKLIQNAINAGFKPSFCVVASVGDLEKMMIETRNVNLSGQPEAAGSISAELAGWIESVERYDTTGLEAKFRRNWTRYSAHQFVMNLAIPFLKEIGDRWADGRLGVSNEHFASEVLQMFLFRHWRPLASRNRGPKVLLASLEGELHNLGLHIAAMLLVLADFEAILLGANTPHEEISRAVQSSGAVAAVIGLAKSSDVKKSRRELQDLRDNLPPSIVIIVGGNENLGKMEGILTLPSLEAFSDWASDFSRI